jgi:divalent metal cation (Fe/Co/Zn/Cd) transporter
VTQIRARTVGSGSLVDLTVLTDNKISASAAHVIGEKARWKILESIPYVSDVLVRTRSKETVCPLLSRTQRDPVSVEKEVRKALTGFPEIQDVRRVTVHYVNTAILCTEVVIKVDPTLTITSAQTLARQLDKSIKEKVSDVAQVEVHLDLGNASGEESPFDMSYGGKSLVTA